MRHNRIPTWLVAISININNLTGGPRGWSLCARFYAGRLEGYRVHRWLVAITDRLFWFDPQHCRKAWLLRSQAAGE